MKIQEGPIQLTEGNIYRQMLRLCIPLVAGSLMQQLYTIADSVIVGRCVGTEALAATGAVDPIINLLIGLLVGISGGAGIVVAQAFGKGDEELIEKTVHTIMAYGMILGAAFTLIGVASTPLWLKVMRMPEDVARYAKVYLMTYFAGTLFTMLYNMGASILNSVGNVMKAMKFASFAAALNIVLDVLFVIPMHMGIFGAALATVLSQMTACVLVIASLVRTDESYKVDLSRIRLVKGITGTITKMGLSTGVQNIVRSVANMTVQTCINLFGTAAIAGYAIFIRIDGVEWLVVISLTVAAQTFAGQNTGAAETERVRKGTAAAVVIGASYSAVTGILMIALREPVIGLFTSDADAMRYAVQSMMWFAPFYMLFATAQALYGSVSGTGRAVQVLIIYTAAFCVFRMIWVLTAVSTVHTIDSILSVFPLSWILGIILMLLYMKKSTWPFAPEEKKEK